MSICHFVTKFGDGGIVTDNDNLIDGVISPMDPVQQMMPAECVQILLQLPFDLPSGQCMRQAIDRQLGTFRDTAEYMLKGTACFQDRLCHYFACSPAALVQWPVDILNTRMGPAGFGMPYQVDFFHGMHYLILMQS